MKILVKTMFGLEEVLQKEVEGLGVQNVIKLNRAVTFEGDLDLLYKANHYLRTALRVLVEIAEFEANNTEELYKEVSKINWDNYLQLNQTFAIFPTVNSDLFTHSKYASLKTKDAIADFFTAKYQKRPSVSVESADVYFNLHIFKNKVTVSLDSSGDSLHKRGYRLGGHTAPLNECLAAGMILLSEWDKQSTLLDPFCGTGTLLFEAAMIACNVPPGFMRKRYAFMNWPNFDSNLWQQIRKQSLVRKRKLEAQLIGCDQNAALIRKLDVYKDKFDFLKAIDLYPISFESFKPKSEEPGLIITNPPYGERFDNVDVFNLYSAIGSHLKHRYMGYSCWILSANKDALKNVGLKTSVRKVLYNGALECGFYKYDLYKGSKKQSKKA